MAESILAVLQSVYRAWQHGGGVLVVMLSLVGTSKQLEIVTHWGLAR